MKIHAVFLCLASLALLGQTPSTEPKPKVQFTTNLGSFTLELEPQAAPKTVENFLDYAKSGFYNGTIFHRVISTFMVQGGGIALSSEKDVEVKRKNDTTITIREKGRTTAGEEKVTGPPIVNEARQAFEMGLKNDRGTIAMARTPHPDSATCQFFVNVVDNAFLNYPGQDGAGYCVFGRVVEGMETIDKIKDVKTVIPGDKPIDPVVITNTKVIAPSAKKRAESKATPKAPAPKSVLAPK